MSKRWYYTDIGIAGFLFSLQEEYAGMNRQPLIRERGNTWELTDKGVKVLKAIEKSADIKILAN